MTHYNNTEHPMTIMALLSSSPLRRIAHIRGALGWRTDRNLTLRVRPNGLDVGYSTRTTLDGDLQLDGAPPIDFDGAISRDLAERIAVAPNCFIELKPDEVERLVNATAKATPPGFGPAIPILDRYEPRNGVLVPVATIRNQLTTQPFTKENTTMTHFLDRAAPEAFRLITRIVDDPDNTIAEVILFEFARKQGSCKRLDHIKGSELRSKTLTQAEVDAIAKPYGAEMGRRNVSDMREPLINPLPDSPFGLAPLLGQRDDANVVFFLAFIGTDSARLALDIDEVLPAISDAILEALARKPKNNAAN